MNIVIDRNAKIGAAAEDLVVRKYQKSGFEILARNFCRPSTGEIDIIAKAQSKIYFVECKCSRTTEQAASLLSEAQKGRMHRTALTYLAENNLPQDTEMRFDAALVDCTGHVDVRVGALN